MRIFLALLLLAVPAFANPQNPAPENVGLYNFTVVSISSSASTTAVVRNVSRNYLLLQNIGTNAITCRPGAAVTGLTNGIVIAAGASYSPVPPLVDAFFCEAATAATNLTVIEGIK